MTWLPWIVPLITGLLGALLVYLPAMRRISGRIETSEARDVWEEARLLRNEYRERATELRRLLDDCQQRYQVAQEKIDRLEARLEGTDE